VSILRALGETPDEPVAVSELRKRVGERDSGKFNYHLGKLAGQFVRRTDDGYQLTIAGHRIVGAILAGTYTTDATLSPVEVDSPCPLCGGRLVAEYADEQARVHCTDCEEWANVVPFPPGTLDQFAPEELPAVFDRWIKVLFAGIFEGFCEICGGRIDGRLTTVDEQPDGVGVFYDCERCGAHSQVSVTMAVVEYTEVACALADRGVDPVETTTWELGHVVDPQVELLGTDPMRARVTFDLGDERLVAEVDADVRLVDVRLEAA
jgi:ribosomal protein S27AE